MTSAVHVPILGFLDVPLTFSLLLGFSLCWFLSRRPAGPSFPPGPKPHLLVGHTFQIPSTRVWTYFEGLGRQYGPIVRLSLAGDDIVVLNSPLDAEELLGRRSKNYSSRRPLVYAGQYQSKNRRLVLLPYGEQLKKQRAAFYMMLQPRVIGSYENMQTIETTSLLYDLLTRPADSNLHAKRWAASLVFTLTYGKRLTDRELKTVLAILDDFIEDCYPGAHLVDTFPILDLLPDVLAPWRAQAKQKHEREIAFYGRLMQEVQEKMIRGKESPDCFAARLLEQQAQHNLDQLAMLYVAGVAFEAGTGTTAGTMLWFLMAVLLYPATLAKAQAELDGVLGAEGEHPPSFANMKELPYCTALCKEVFRWMPAAPGGFPHYSDVDDTYKGYKIRAKTMVIPNIWAMQHDENIFPNPLTFDPDRFLVRDGDGEYDDNYLTEGHWGFGFGRRICPGRFLAAKSVWIGIVSIMWAFSVQPARDANGQEIKVDPNDCTSGITSEPQPFPVRILPRTATHAETIRRLWQKTSL